MPRVVTITRPDVIDLIERVARLETGGNKTEAVALGMRSLLERAAARRDGDPFAGLGEGMRIAADLELDRRELDDAALNAMERRMLRPFLDPAPESDLPFETQIVSARRGGS